MGWKLSTESVRAVVSVVSVAEATFAKSNKNNAATEAMGIAVRQPPMRFVPIKDVGQQNIQALHRARELLVNNARC
jgi:hypothetical protein